MSGAESPPPARPPSRARWKARLRGFFLNSVLIAVSLIAACSVGEVAVRLAAPQQLIQLRPDIWMPLEGLGWVHRPNVKTQINTGEGMVDFFTDGEGFRVGAGGRTDARQRILLLGDSFMEALQVNHEDSLAGQMEERLSLAAGEPVAVDNAGVGGWGPSHYLLQTREALARQAYAAVVVALYLGNDIEGRRQESFAAREQSPRASFRWPGRLTWKEMVAAFLRPVNDTLETRSHLFTLAKNRTQVLRTKMGLTPRYMPKSILVSERDSPRWEVTAAICRDLAALAADHGATAIFVLIPAPYQVLPELLEEYLGGFGIAPDAVDIDQSNRLLGEALRGLDLTVLDLTPRFRRRVAGGESLYGTVDQHLNIEGHALATESLLLVLEPPPQD